MVGIFFFSSEVCMIDTNQAYSMPTELAIIWPKYSNFSRVIYKRMDSVIQNLSYEINVARCQALDINTSTGYTREHLASREADFQYLFGYEKRAA